jgi:hypothetical protein
LFFPYANGVYVSCDDRLLVARIQRYLERIPALAAVLAAVLAAGL